ncbi:hypothetical protein, partial [Sphingobium sp.]|uniref:hypothetical protein n=1 Tax=Sphingobium sp. TaxID=1912891 RepID=UPI002C679238
RHLRAGPVLEAGRMNDATIRGWVARYDLKLGDRAARESGNPRYDLADCARVFMLHILTENLRINGKTAVWIVNKAHVYIGIIAEYELSAIDKGCAPDCPRYILTLPAASLHSEINPEIRLYGEAAAIADREANRGRWCEIVMDLREIVRHARNALTNVLGHSTSGLRHDFADAPEPAFETSAA